MMNTDFLEAFLSCRCLGDFISLAPDDRGSQEKKFRVVVDNEDFGFIAYF
jgi:hypothetical protein